MSALCVVDQVPATMGNLCTPCARALRGVVLQVPQVVAELRVTEVKQSRQSAPGGGGHSGARPLVINLNATEARREVAAWARRAVRIVEDAAGPVPVGRAVVPWVVSHLDVLARSPEVLGLYVGLSDAVAAGWRTVDRDPDRTIVGGCECGAPLVSTRTEGAVWCARCGRSYDIAERLAARADLVAGLELGTADLVTALRTAIGVKVSEAGVRKWVARGQLAPVSESPRRFRVADALECWRAMHGPAPGDTPEAGARVDVAGLSR